MPIHDDDDDDTDDAMLMTMILIMIQAYSLALHYVCLGLCDRVDG
jgi:hypothetical protein